MFMICFLYFYILFSICIFLQQSVDELINMAHKFYDEIALPKLVTLHSSMDSTFL